MAKKIEGFVYTNNVPTEGGNRLRDTTVTFFPAEDPNSEMTNKATLVIGDERVFTESEVVAILRECEYQLETLSIGKVKVGLTGILHGRGISDPA